VTVPPVLIAEAVTVPVVLIPVDPPIVPEVIAAPLTLPAVEIVESFVSAMAAVAETSASTMIPGVRVSGIVIFALPLKLVAVPVASPEMAMVLAV
jgi:hypothetical protein